MYGTSPVPVLHRHYTMANKNSVIYANKKVSYTHNVLFGFLSCNPMICLYLTLIATLDTMFPTLPFGTARHGCTRPVVTPSGPMLQNFLGSSSRNGRKIDSRRRDLIEGSKAAPLRSYTIGCPACFTLKKRSG